MLSVAIWKDGSQDRIFDTFDHGLEFAIEPRIASMGKRTNGPTFVEVQPTARRMSFVSLSYPCYAKRKVILSFLYLHISLSGIESGAHFLRALN